MQSSLAKFRCLQRRLERLVDSLFDDDRQKRRRRRRRKRSS